MAIVQISKIQVRSGNLADMPQLSLGEFGLAQDTNQLFIGTNANVIGPVPDNLEILTINSNANIPAGGPNNSIQFNANGGLAGSANLTFNSSNSVLGINGAIVPAGNGVWNLGTPTSRWNSLYVSGNSVDIAGVPIGSNGTFLNAPNLLITNVLSAVGLAANVSQINYLQANTIESPGNVSANLFLGTLGSNTGNSNVQASANAVSVSANNLANVVVISSTGTGGRGITTLNGDVFIPGGNLQVVGNLSYTNIINYTLSTPLLELGTGPGGAPLPAPDNFDRGVVAHNYGNGVVDNLRFMGWQTSTNQFIVANVTQSGNVVNVLNLANIQGNYWVGNVWSNIIYSNATGNANAAVQGDRYYPDGSFVTGVLGLNASGVGIGVYGTRGNVSAGYAGFFDGPTKITDLTTGSNTVLGNMTGNWQLTAGSKLEATYADLAEYYIPDAEYGPGTVLSLGGTAEVTVTTPENSDRIAGVVTTDPAYTMNSTLASQGGVAIALIGRVPVRVVGTIAKGDSLYASDIPGVATARDQSPTLGCLIGRAIQNYNSDEPGMIEAQVGRP